MSSKASLEELTRAEYWDRRYNAGAGEGEGEGEGEEAAAEERNISIGTHRYDWIRSFDAVSPFLLSHLPAPAEGGRILQLGCGNSTLSGDLRDLGYTDQVSVDFSSVVIAQMQTQFPDLTWQVEDIRRMTFPPASFDIAIDKATLDAMLYGSLWDPEPEVRHNVGAYVDEVARVLKPAGLWLYITWRQPHFIKPLLARPELWSVESEVLSDGGGMFEYYGYVMRKFS